MRCFHTVIVAFTKLSSSSASSSMKAVVSGASSRERPTPSEAKPNVIGKMLHNEKYKGCTLMQKTYGEDLLSGKRKKNRGEIKQYYYENTHPAIVSKELYEEVQLQLNAK